MKDDNFEWDNYINTVWGNSGSDMVTMWKRCGPSIIIRKWFLF